MSYCPQHHLQMNKPQKIAEDLRCLEEECDLSMQLCLRTTCETNQLAQKTAEKINAQTEQMKSIKNNTEEIRYNLDTSEYMLNSMKSFWCSIAQSFFKNFSLHNDKSNSNLEDINVSRSDKNVAKIDSARAFSKQSNLSGFATDDQSCSLRANFYNYPSSSLSSSSSVQLLSSSSDLQKLASSKSNFEKKIDSDLDSLSLMLDEIHDKAIQMNSAIKVQNSLLDEIHGNIEQNSVRMKKQQKDMNDIMSR